MTAKVDRIKERKDIAGFIEDTMPDSMVCGTCRNCKPRSPYSVAYLYCQELRFKVTNKGRFGWCRHWRSAR